MECKHLWELAWSADICESWRGVQRKCPCKWLVHVLLATLRASCRSLLALVAPKQGATPRINPPRAIVTALRTFWPLSVLLSSILAEQEQILSEINWVRTIQYSIYSEGGSSCTLPPSPTRELPDAVWGEKKHHRKVQKQISEASLIVLGFTIYFTGVLVSLSASFSLLCFLFLCTYVLACTQGTTGCLPASSSSKTFKMLSYNLITHWKASLSNKTLWFHPCHG